MTKTYAVEVTGVLGDKWMSGYRDTRDEARRVANFLLNLGFDNSQRAAVKSVKVVEIK